MACSLLCLPGRVAQRRHQRCRSGESVCAARRVWPRECSVVVRCERSAEFTTSLLDALCMSD
eukprot:2555687-Pleurochrysis_carterae.AAC.2